jgi:hypothetical protein
VPTVVEARTRELERENAELRRANEILKAASPFFAAAQLNRRLRWSSTTSTLITTASGRADLPDLSEHDLPIAPATYHASKTRPVSDADGDDADMANTALDLGRASRSLGGRTSWPQATTMHRVGRDQVARLMGVVAIEGVRRGRHRAVTTVGDPTAARHPTSSAGR